MRIPSRKNIPSAIYEIENTVLADDGFLPLSGSFPIVCGAAVAAPLLSSPHREAHGCRPPRGTGADRAKGAALLH